MASKKNTNDKRLSTDGYKKNGNSFTDNLTKDEIKQLLEDYRKEKIEKIARGKHVRYFATDNEGHKKFRTGGILINNAGLPDYVVLSNGGKNWSVQTEDTIFYVQMSISDIKKEFQDTLFKKDEEIKHLR